MEMIIQTEPTPNPNALKFLPNVEVRGNKSPLFYKKDPKGNPDADAPVAYALFKINGIQDVFFGSDFITVGKNEATEWSEIKTEIIETIKYHSSGPFVVEAVKPACDEINSDAGLDKVTKKIVHLLDERVRPAVAMDGGDIIFHDFKNGIVYLEMYGACSGCPSSTATLKMGIENMLRHYIPEVHSVEAI
jgi:Fe-S cluster biogenesis protein NfuA|tara:strand:- start:537 stop:1106 length:570 start_codon:yes stop_codon:yes gene_type:complete